MQILTNKHIHDKVEPKVITFKTKKMSEKQSVTEFQSTEEARKHAKRTRVNDALVDTTALVLAGALTFGGQTAAYAETNNATSHEVTLGNNEAVVTGLNPTDAALEAGSIAIDVDGSVIEQHTPAYEYETGAFQYDPEATCHVRDEQWLVEHGMPSAYIKLVYARADIDPTTASLSEKIDAFKDAMVDCYTKDPYIFAGNKLMLEHSTDGVAINQDMINTYGDALIADPARWQDEFESYMALFESPDNTCSVGRAEPGTHMTTYTSNADSPDGRFRIYMAGPSRIGTDILILQLPNGQSVAFKECLQPAWTTGTELEIPSEGVPDLIVDLPIIDTDQCEPDGFPVIVPPILLPPTTFVDKPGVPHPIVPGILPSALTVPKPDYASLTGSGIDHSKGKTHQGYASIASHNKQPTWLNDGSNVGSRKGRGRTSTVRTPNARRGR